MNINNFISFVGVGIAILSSWKLFKDRKSIIYNALLCALGVALLIASLHKESQEEKAGAIATEKSRQKDSLAEAKRIESNNVLINGFGEAIGKYSLGYDSAKKEISLLRQLIQDSFNLKTTIIQAESPTLTFCGKGLQSGGRKGDSIFVTLYICVNSASCIVKDMYAYTFLAKSINDTLAMTFVDKKAVLYKNLSIATHQVQVVELSFVGKYADITHVVMALKGHYTNSYGKDLKEVDNAGILNLKTNEFSISQPYGNSINKFIISNRVRINKSFDSINRTR